MTAGRMHPLGLLLVAALPLAGCASPNPFTARRSSVGTLKESVSRLEYENEQLRSELAAARTETRRLANDLDQVETNNEELVARLRDARSLLDGESANGSELIRPRPSSDDDRPAIPAGNRGRKAPFTQIPGRINIPAPPEDPDDDLDARTYRRPLKAKAEGSSREPRRWLPVSRGASDPTPKLSGPNPRGKAIA